MRKVFFCGSLLMVCVLFVSGCSRQLETGLTQDDAQQIVVVLRENGIHAETELDLTQKKDAAAWLVNVRGQNDTVIRAWKILRENGLPREKVKGLDDVFANSGIIPTAAEEKARLISGIDGELTRTLDTLPGVVDARVQVVLPDNTPLLDKSQQSPPTASALIQFRGDQPPLKDVEVKGLMAKSVEGLMPENVAVVFKKVEITPIPKEILGPFSLNAWIEVVALGLAGVASFTSLLVLSLSQQRKLKIKTLEKQLTQMKNISEASSSIVKS
jgi:type III secretion protein J